MLRARRRHFVHRALFLTASILLVIAPRLDAATPAVRVGTEFIVPTYTTGLQGYATVALADNGGFVVVWSSYSSQDGDDRGVFARRFNSAGVALATEFQVNSYTPGPQGLPSAAFAANGAFVIAWTGYGDQDGSLNGVFARRFDSAGVAQATEFQVNSFTTGHQLVPSVGASDGGGFVIAWTSFQTSQDGSGAGVFARRFNASGVAQASEFQANDFTTGDQEFPSVSLDADGEFVVAWTSNGQDGSLRGMFGRRFDQLGAPKGSEFQINTYTPGDQSFGGVSLDSDGDFVVFWNGPGQDGSGVLARRYNSAGAALASEFLVAGGRFGGLHGISLSAGGDFVIAYQGDGSDGSSNGILARQFDSNGVPLSTELQVNSYTTGSQMAAAVSLDASGDFVIAWHGSGAGDSDTGIFAQRFRSPAVLDIDGNGVVDPLTDGVLALRREFGFTGGTLVTGAVGPNCTRCDAPSIEAYLQPLL